MSGRETANGRTPRAGAPAPAEADPRLVEVPVRPGEAILADLTLPREARGLVVFAHGSGSGRKSPRNRLVATSLHRVRIATVLLDLLTSEEAREDEVSRRYRFDIRLLTERLLQAISWSREQRGLSRLPLGLYGASTGGTAVLRAAAAHPTDLFALVLRGARTDLVPREVLRHVLTPTLLIVGEHDTDVLSMNRETLLSLPSSSDLSIVPGATHLFEEAGAMRQVAQLTSDWFGSHLKPAQPPTSEGPSWGDPRLASKVLVNPV